MKISTAVMTWTLTLLGATFANAQNVPESATRIGTFDSRSVALAYYRSPDGIERMSQEWDQQWKDAEAAGDSTRMEELKRFKPSMQHLMHQQVFSTGSICNVMREIEDQLPEVASEASVSLIVSQWEIPYSAPGVELVDVTPQLVALFDVDEAVRRQVAQMGDVEPVPLEELLYDPEH